MRVDLSPSLLAAGASNEPAGTHTSRTMMLEELGALLGSCSRVATYDEYASAIVDDNVLGKRTRSTRQKSLRHLRELYALDGRVPLFGALRVLWYQDDRSRPLLALMSSAARDPLVRCTVAMVHDIAPGRHVGAGDLADAVQAAFPARFSADVQDRIGRNLASTWTQSGHLVAVSKAAPKERARLNVTPVAATYALYLGHLAGKAGPMLFRGTWADLLDADDRTMQGLAEDAARGGWVGYSSGGGMVQVDFDAFEARIAREVA